MGCSGLTEVIINSMKLNSCGDSIFSGCNITTVKLPEEMEVIPKQLFRNAGMSVASEITIPSKVTVIGESAFNGAGNLSKVTFAGDNVVEIGNAAFYGCKSLSEITIPSKVEKIGNQAFYNCKSLTTITIPSEVTSIGNQAFMGCSELRKAVIPASVKEIGSAAFDGINKNLFKIYTVNGSYAHEWAVINGYTIGVSNSIIYNLNGGINNPGNPDIYETGEVITFREPTKAGYTFEGWYKDKEFKIPITSTEGAQENITLYAKWKLATYSITYDLDGGTVTGNPTSYNINKLVKLKTPKKTGYTFAGWYMTQEGKEPEKVTTIAKGTSGDLLLTAKWEENKYNIKFMGNGGMTESGKDSVTVTHLYSLEESLISNSFVKEGYEFVGWNTKKNGKGTTYNDQELISKLSEKNNTIITLYAVWEPEKFWITYELNADDAVNLNPAYYNITKDVSLKNPTNPGYTFAGWYLDEACTSRVKKISKKWAEDIALYAKWTENVYNVTFNTNGGKAAQGIVTKQKGIAYTQMIDFPEIGTITRDGYILREWNTKKDGSGMSYGLTDCGFKKENAPAKNKGTLTLYAVWDAIPYPITYELNGGTQNPNPEYYTVAKDIKLQTPVKPGYTFLGWYSDEGLTTKITSIKKNTKAPVTVYAKWQLKSAMHRRCCCVSLRASRHIPMHSCRPVSPTRNSALRSRAVMHWKRQDWQLLWST